MENLIKSGSVLTGEKITVRPIRRLSDWLPEGHDSQFMNDGTSWSLCVPMLQGKKALADPLKGLSSSQKEELAEKLGLESASLFNVFRPDSYWKGFQIPLTKDGRILDLSDPYDYIIYRVLSINTDLIAPTYEMRNMKQTYKFALEREEEKLTGEISSVNKKQKAYLALSKMDQSRDMMTNFLWAHYLQVKTAVRPPIDASADWLKKEIGKIIEHDSGLFIQIAEDETYPYKVLIMKALNIGALARSGDSYKFPDDDRVIGSLGQLVMHLADDRNQEVLLKLKTQIEIAQKQTLNESVSAAGKQIMDDFPAPSTVEDPEAGDGLTLPEDIKDVQEQKDDDENNSGYDKPGYDSPNYNPELD